MFGMGHICTINCWILKGMQRHTISKGILLATIYCIKNITTSLKTLHTEYSTYIYVYIYICILQIKPTKVAWEGWGRGKGNTFFLCLTGKGTGGADDILKPFPPGNPFVRTHARHKTISRLAPPNLRSRCRKMYQKISTYTKYTKLYQHRVQQTIINVLWAEAFRLRSGTHLYNQMVLSRYSTMRYARCFHQCSKAITHLWGAKKLRLLAQNCIEYSFKLHCNISLLLCCFIRLRHEDNEIW